MKNLILAFVIVTAIVIIAWWPLAEKVGHGSWLAMHVIVPMGIAAIALLVFRLLRSLMVAVLCALAIAGVAFLLFREYGPQLRPILEKVLP
jgi:hypothetical protein